LVFPSTYKYKYELKQGYRLPDPHSIVKIVVCGPTCIGKSTLCSRFIYGHFIEEYDPTIEDGWRKQMKFHDNIIYFDILDCSSTTDYSGMKEMWYRHAQAFILGYSISSKYSFEQIQTQAELECIARVRDVDSINEVPIILVGFKSDLENYREVSFGEGQQLSEKYGIPFIEISSKLDQNVIPLFTMATELCFLHETRTAKI